jgi:enoyl-[acyl-carrier protein] reductase I
MAADLGPDSIRVNGISAGPIKTLAASGVSGFRSMLKHVESKTSLRRNVTIEDVGNTAAFLGSDLSSGMTGEILYVDAGYRNLGMNFDME